MHVLDTLVKLLYRPSCIKLISLYFLAFDLSCYFVPTDTWLHSDVYGDVRHFLIPGCARFDHAVDGDNRRDGSLALHTFMLAYLCPWFGSLALPARREVLRYV